MVKRRVYIHGNGRGRVVRFRGSSSSLNTRAFKMRRGKIIWMGFFVLSDSANGVGIPQLIMEAGVMLSYVQKRQKNSAGRLSRVKAPLGGYWVWDRLWKIRRWLIMPCESDWGH